MRINRNEKNLKLITGNLATQERIYGALAICGFILCAASFIGFALTGFFVVGRMGLKYFPFILIPFFAFPLSMMLGVFFLTKKNYVKNIKNIADGIKFSDEKLIAEMFGVSDFQIKQGAEIVAKLIETGNLDGYELIGGVMVAKKTLMFTEEEAVARNDAYLQPYRAMDEAKAAAAAGPVLTECPHCGAPITNTKARFCQYCGKLIK